MNRKKKFLTPPIGRLSKSDYSGLIKLSLEEDKARGDITTNSIFSGKHKTMARLVARESGILAGLEIFRDTYKMLNGRLNIKTHYKDGALVKRGSLIAEVKGDTISILQGERTAVNFVSMLSGIATETGKVVKKVPSGVALLDTRKTLPAYRKLSKYAVSVGGGLNHRIDLAAMAMIKDNHIAAAGSISEAIDLVRKKNPRKKLEVEVDTLKQLQEALPALPDIVLLDNMEPETLKKATSLVRKFNREQKKSILTEASGGYNINNLDKLKGTGVDFVSMGNLTNRIVPLDFSLEIL